MEIHAIKWLNFKNTMLKERILMIAIKEDTAITFPEPLPGRGI